MQTYYEEIFSFKYRRLGINTHAYTQHVNGSKGLIFTCEFLCGKKRDLNPFDVRIPMISLQLLA